MAPLRKLYRNRGVPPACIGCGQRLPSSKARVQTPSGNWACPDCAYRLDKPDAPRIVRQAKPKAPQAERLPLGGRGAE